MTGQQYIYLVTEHVYLYKLPLYHLKMYLLDSGQVVITGSSWEG